MGVPPYRVRLCHLSGLLLTPSHGTFVGGHSSQPGKSLVSRAQAGFQPHLSPLLNICPPVGGSSADNVLRPREPHLQGNAHEYELSRLRGRVLQGTWEGREDVCLGKEVSLFGEEPLGDLSW